MTCFQAKITNETASFLKKILHGINSFQKANELLKTTCGIIDFFDTEQELIELKTTLKEKLTIVEKPNRREYGDFQTNNILTKKVVQLIDNQSFNPDLIIEPTCGKGNFILAALAQFTSIKKIIGVEIYYPYIWETKFKILDYYVNQSVSNLPEIQIIHANIFDFSFAELAKENWHYKTLIIGNPPWVTNSELGAIDSQNLPRKSNFKNVNGLDAITGKGNFDIGEYITTDLLKLFDKHNGKIAFLVKNAVIKNLITNQKKANFNIGNIQQFNIDAKQEFSASVEAALFLADLNQTPKYVCQSFNFYTQLIENQFGWLDEKFVFSIKDYAKSAKIDGVCQLVWRQGLKHDCSKIMELDRNNGHYINNLKEEVELEKALLYGLLKSSDLKDLEIKSYRKTTIVTQKKVGQNTDYIQRNYPKTFDYLNRNKKYFDKRKSIIYKGKPAFSIFGIGDYSFATYKVAISGLYKRTHFSLIYPENEKPIMLDDTCYFIGFDNFEDAKIAQLILNSHLVQIFLKSIIFPDAKRAITKDVLMRIDLEKAINLLLDNVNFELERIEQLNYFKDKYVKNTQLSLF